MGNNTFGVLCTSTVLPAGENLSVNLSGALLSFAMGSNHSVVLTNSSLYVCGSNSAG